MQLVFVCLFVSREVLFWSILAGGDWIVCPWVGESMSGEVERNRPNAKWEFFYLLIHRKD